MRIGVNNDHKFSLKKHEKFRVPFVFLKSMGEMTKYVIQSRVVFCG